MGSLNWFSFYRLFFFLLRNFDPEGDAAQELVPFVVVAEVGALYAALHGQLLVVVLLGEQQLHRHQRLHVILVGFPAVIGEIHLIDATLTGEIVHLDWAVFFYCAVDIRISMRLQSNDPVHFQNNAWFSFMVSKVRVGEARAEAQGCPLEATSLLVHVIAIVLQAIVSWSAVLIHLLLRIIIPSEEGLQVPDILFVLLRFRFVE